jgi:hypothetical protein
MAQDSLRTGKHWRLYLWKGAHHASCLDQSVENPFVPKMDFSAPIFAWSSTMARATDAPIVSFGCGSWNRSIYSVTISAIYDCRETESNSG